MPQKISKDIKRICRRCGVEFYPRARKQFYCNEVKVGTCSICGSRFEYICNSTKPKETCSSKCTSKLSKIKIEENQKDSIRICKWCGKKFTPKTSRDLYCSDLHYKICEVCGSKFTIDVKSSEKYNRTCSLKCKNILSLDNRDIEKEKQSLKSSLLKRYGVDNIMKVDGVSEKIKETNLKRYGVEWYTQTDEYKERIRETSLEKYGVEHHLSNRDVINKRNETNLEKYGSKNVFSSYYGKMKSKSTMLSKYGVDNPSKNREFKSKATKNSRNSKLEERICNLFDNYVIEYIHHYFLDNKDTNCSHEFDFYLPKYKLLIDADGLYFHSYLGDTDGYRSKDYYDDIRISLIPKDHLFYLIVEGNENRQMKEIVSILEDIDSNIFDYESYLFKWCRDIGFPYPSYTNERMMKDWANLFKYKNEIYVPQCRFGESIIKNYHKSIFNCRVGNSLSPIDAWYSDEKLKKVIRNRLIYVNNVEPSKILRGFNISKICPAVSMFNPVLAKYIVKKYLNEFDEIFDPFSGFSGRLLGVKSVGKTYIGQDLNENAVNESNEIIHLLNLENCSVEEKDIFESYGEYECLLTCPPYNKKEIYNTETVFKSCDEWIDECLDRFKCKKYVFVVDETEKYSEYITETIKSTSHFSNVEEKIIVIE